MRRKIEIGFFLFFLALAFNAHGAWGQKPLPPSSNIILVDDFDQAFSANHLGGAYGLVAQGGDAQLQFIQPSVPYLANNSALKINYQLTSSPGYAFLWMKLGKHKESPEASEYLNLQDFVFLSFKFKAPPSVQFKVEIHEDLDDDGRFDFASDRISFVYTDGVKKFPLEGDWFKVLMPLKRFSGIKDWSKILEMVFVFEKDRAGKSGEVLLEDLIFIRKELKKQSAQAGGILKDVSVKINNQPASSGMPLKGANRIDLSYQPAEGFEDMESIALELRTSANEPWTPVVTEFNPGASHTSLIWETFTFAPPEKTALRIVVHDFLGKASVLAGPFEGLQVPVLTDEQFLDLVEQKAFLYFLENQHSEHGLFYDTTGGGDLSIAVTGFGLTALAIGSQRGWVDKKEAERRALLCLESFLKKVEGHEGFYYHFVNASTLKRAGTSEVSTVDTALLLTGAITAGEYFGGKVKKKAEELYKRANWSYYLNKNPDEEHYLKFHHGWTPEGQLADNYWDYYTDETLMLDLLGIGAPKHEVSPEVFYTFQRRQGSYKEMEPFIYTWHGGLFSYQYASAWYDFRHQVDRKDMNWYENSKQATLSNRAFVIDHASEYKTYGPDIWGITSMRVPEKYVMHYGPIPNGLNHAEHDGTIGPSGPGGSMMFTPYHSLRALKTFYIRHPDLWGIYGFKDSINLDRNWISPVYYGLGQGILLLSIENFRSGLIWELFGKNKAVRNGLKRAEFKAAAKKSSARIDYEAAKQKVEAGEAALKSSAQPKDWILLAKHYVQLLETLQVDDVDVARLYLTYGDAYKKKALEQFDRALEAPITEAERLEVYRQKIDLLNSVISPAERDQIQDRMARELKSGIKKGVYNMAWVLKWAESLDEDTAFKIRSEFRENLSPSERKILHEAVKKKAEQAFAQGDYHKAGLLVEEQIAFLEQQADKPALTEFLEEWAKSFAEVQKYAEAERFYRRIMEDFGAPEKREEIYLLLNKMLETKGDKERAIKEYQNFMKDFPESAHIPEVMSRLANIESGLGNRDRAISILQNIIQNYAGTPHAQESTYLLGMVYYHAGRFSEAIRTWEGFLKEYPDSRRGDIVRNYLEKADRNEAG